MSGGCPCWVSVYALGHEGHCCFVHGDRKVDNGFRESDEICHVPDGGPRVTVNPLDLTERQRWGNDAEQAEG